MANMKNSMPDIDERELANLTRDLDAMHKDTFPTAIAALAEIREKALDTISDTRGLAGVRASRRGFLAGGLATAGAVGGGILLAACGTEATPSASATAAAAAGDITLAKLNAGVETLAVFAYGAALTAAGAGKLGAVPAVVQQFATTAKAQHTDHAGAWNEVLTAAGQATVSKNNAKLEPTVTAALGSVKTIVDVAKLALTLESVALATYNKNVGDFADAKYRQLALTIAPVEAQHAAILNFVLGNYPVPDSVIKLDGALTAADA